MIYPPYEHYFNHDNLTEHFPDSLFVPHVHQAKHRCLILEHRCKQYCLHDCYNSRQTKHDSPIIRSDHLSMCLWCAKTKCKAYESACENRELRDSSQGATHPDRGSLVNYKCFQLIWTYWTLEQSQLRSHSRQSLRGICRVQLFERFQ